MAQAPIQALGMAWYRREDYPRVLEIMEDRDKLYSNFDDWEKAAKTGESRLASGGNIVVRVFIDPATFPDWCRKRGLKVDAHARMQFGNEMVYQQIKR